MAQPSDESKSAVSKDTSTLFQTLLGMSIDHKKRNGDEKQKLSSAPQEKSSFVLMSTQFIVCGGESPSPLLPRARSARWSADLPSTFCPHAPCGICALPSSPPSGALLHSRPSHLPTLPAYSCEGGAVQTRWSGVGPLVA